jgi:hypothetical protein
MPSIRFNRSEILRHAWDLYRQQLALIAAADHYHCAPGYDHWAAALRQAWATAKSVAYYVGKGYTDFSPLIITEWETQK